jgi:pyridinium-3,5-bisthiocarboxylic acid mononucleotide nickel chelatase
VQIETNIDDMNPEFYGAVSDALFAAGALDVWLTPIQMKKGRPGVLLSVLASAAQESTLAQMLLRQTTTLGVRVRSVHRHEARRTFAMVETAYGEIQIKLKWLDGQVVGAKPEFEACRRLAEAQGVPVRLVYEAALGAAQKEQLID